MLHLRTDLFLAGALLRAGFYEHEARLLVSLVSLWRLRIVLPECWFSIVSLVVSVLTCVVESCLLN